MVEASEVFFDLAKHLSDARRGFEHAFDLRQDAGVVYIDMRDLMIDDGKGLRAAEIECFEAELVFDGKPALLAEDAVEMHRL